ncbi:MAG: type IV secretion protein IcmB [Gammaproteobacteria bacterium]|nr:type IV secretion protein IcmB [Gammaproteobacteria bacterium]
MQWLSTSFKQTTGSYCELETALDNHILASRNGSLISVFRLDGIQFIVGQQEFDHMHNGICQVLQAAMSRPGHNIQVVFGSDRELVSNDIKDSLLPAWDTARRLSLELDDLFQEKINYLSKYCSNEDCYLVLWTTPRHLGKQQLKDATKRKRQQLKDLKIPPMRNAQGLFAPLLELKDSHMSLANSIVASFKDLKMSLELLDVHTALKSIRMIVDPRFTSQDWKPYLPGDKIPLRAKKEEDDRDQDISELMWPALSGQLIPRDGENIDLRTARLGDYIYAPVFIDLFPKDIKIFNVLFQRVSSTRIPWRISYFIESSGLSTIAVKSTVASILSFANRYNKLINDAKQLLDYININTDDSIVRLRVALTTWAPATQPEVLRSRTAELVKAVQGWGNCDVGEISGDSFGAVISTCPGLNTDHVATPSIAPLSDVIKMLPMTRPASIWKQGAMLLRSPDGKLWPYQPGSTQQTTWIDLVYARPGSGKSVLSNAINLALCLQGGVKRLPRVGIIDIGPSSSGLISLLKEALPKCDRHLVAYHRLQMTKDYCINPFDTQLGCRRPTAQERSFLVNFLSLLATPVNATSTYDGMLDMVGMIIDELYKSKSDEINPTRYTATMDPLIDTVLDEIDYRADDHTSWWEITDALFKAKRIHEASLAQRYAVPVLADTTAICRTPAIEDLYGKVTVSTGENLIEAFSRMISGALREYPILSDITVFDLGESRVVSLDLDEVAKSGGEAADRQTAVMYMVARYILGRSYYLTLESLADMPALYKDYQAVRISEIREDPKRLVMDEFHRTSKARAVRDQVIIDMREGRKWNVQIALLSQSLADFDETMIEFATSIFIMDAGPVTAIEKSSNIFGLSPTEKLALRNKVHGPRAGGGTFLAQFATKNGINTQLLTNTLGPIELWAFSTTAQDAKIRNELYDRIGPVNARRVLAHMFPGGSVAALLEQRLLALKDIGEISVDSSNSLLSELLEEIIDEYHTNPIFRSQKFQVSI